MHNQSTEMLFIPYEFDTFLDRRPWANWIIIALCVTFMAVSWTGNLDREVKEGLVLQSWMPTQMLGHMFLHGDIMHLTGNMIFLWVFGNALCSNTSNALYPLIYFGCGLFAASVHLLMDGSPAVGASGAINGIVGMILAIYPLNQVSVFWLFMIKGGTFTVQAWVIILFWLAFDIWGAATGGSGVAYWAHLGGFLGGFGAGLALLKLGIIQTTLWDNETMLELFSRDKAEDS